MLLLREFQINFKYKSLAPYVEHGKRVAGTTIPRVVSIKGPIIAESDQEKLDIMLERFKMFDVDG
jgi:hypothetical protein